MIKIKAIGVNMRVLEEDHAEYDPANKDLIIKRISEIKKYSYILTRIYCQYFVYYIPNLRIIETIPRRCFSYTTKVFINGYIWEKVDFCDSCYEQHECAQYCSSCDFSRAKDSEIFFHFGYTAKFEGYPSVNYTREKLRRQTLKDLQTV